MRRHHSLFDVIVCDAEKGTGGGLAGALPPAAAPTPAAPAITPSPTSTPGSPAPAATPPAEAPAIYMPEGLPEALKGKTQAEVVDKLWADIKARPAPPEKPDGYTFEAKGDLAGVIDVKSDPVLPIFRTIAHKHGLSQQQFDGVITDLFTDMGKQGLIEKPIDLTAELVALSDGKGDPKANLAAGERVLRETVDEIKGFVTRGKIDAKTAELLSGVMMSDANQVKAMRTLIRALAPGAGVQPGGASSAPGGDPAMDQAAQQMAALYPSMMKK